MDPYERSKIADALKPLKFKKGEYVVREVFILIIKKLIKGSFIYLIYKI